MYMYHDEISLHEFEEPDVRFFPAYSWVWNMPLDEETIRAQIDGMLEREIRGVYILPESKNFRPKNMPTMLEPDYMSAEYLALYRKATEYAASKGMSLWLYDEDGWPSGYCGGQVLQDNPALESRAVRRVPVKLSPGETLYPAEDILSAFDCSGKRIALPFTAPHDPEVHSAEEVTVYRLERGTHHRAYPDLLNPDATDTFLRLTHERIKTVAGDYFGRGLDLAFNDESVVDITAWTPGLDGLFRERFGYDILDFLPALFGVSPGDTAGIQARIDYYELVGELFARNYFSRIRDWCAENGLLSGGHLGGENETLGCMRHGYIQPLRMLRCFDVPGIDTIWRQIFPKEREQRGGHIEGENNFFPRLASSAATQTGSIVSLSESFAIYGSGLTCAQMRYVNNFQMVRGINVINVMNLTYGHDDFLIAGARPSFSPLFPGASDMAHYNSFSARMSYLMSAGKPYTHAALYMPFCDFRADAQNAQSRAAEFEAIGFAVERAQGSFDLIDDDFIIAADENALDKGVLQGGLAAYREIYIPHCEYMPEETRSRLERLSAAGAVIYELELPGTELTVRGAAPVSLSGIGKTVSSIVGLAHECTSLRATKRLLSGGELYFVYNEGLDPEENEVTFPNTGHICCFDCEEGQAYIPAHSCRDGRTSVKLRLLSGEGRVFLFYRDRLTERKDPAFTGGEIIRFERFEFRRLRRFKVNAHGYSSEQLDETLRTAECGDWSALTGEDFSGDALYQTRFSLEPEAGARYCLDLGEVKYSCEVFLDDKSLGVRCMPPYSYIFDSALLDADGENLLSIRVSNTSANQFVHTDAFDMWEPNQLGPYHNTTLTFERDSLPSGLFGPIRLLCERLT